MEKIQMLFVYIFTFQGCIKKISTLRMILELFWNRGEVQRTRLTEFFKMCAIDENACEFMIKNSP
jgi:hypothetical protein